MKPERKRKKMIQTANFTGSKEFLEIMENFERAHKGFRFDKEEKNSAFWSKGYFYQSGETNQAFKYFLSGYQLARSIYQK